MNLNQVIMINLIENIEVAENRHRHQLPPVEDPFNLSDFNFVKLFRLRKDDVRNLIHLLEPFMAQGERNTALSTKTKLFTALRFLASGSYQLDIGRNSTVNISQASVSRSIHEVIDAINEPAILNQFIHFPNNINELRNARQRFFNKYEFPGIVGCIDGTHIAIVSPLENEHVYVNRKHYHSLNVQIICDENLKILNVNARFPGSTHDSYIWHNSNIEGFMRNLPIEHQGSFYLLGDSGYPLRPWLMTPILPEPDPFSPEAAYNIAMRRIRSRVEMCIGLWKNCFRCLIKDRVLHYSPQTAAKIINSCAVLHNICVENNIPLYNDDVVDVADVVNGGGQPNLVNNPQNNDLAEGRRVRQMLVQNYFNH